MVDKKAIAETCKHVGRLFQGYACGCLAIPTTIRKGTTEDGYAAFVIGGFCGVVTGFSTLLLPALIEHKYLTLSATAAATNIASGLYELYRYEKNKSAAPSTAPAVSSSTGPEKKNGLEKIAEANPVESDFTDPWKVEIPEYNRREDD